MLVIHGDLFFVMEATRQRMVKPNTASHFANKCSWKGLFVLTKHSDGGGMHGIVPVNPRGAGGGGA